MKAHFCTEFGPAESLKIKNIDRPEPGPGQILVKVAAVGLNFLDTLIIEGKYQVKPELPFAPGAELSGYVEALGDGVTGPKQGARVIAFPGYGGLAEFALAKADEVVEVPEELDLVTAAALPVAYGTALHALKDRAALKPGESVLILGAGGGVGLASVSCAKALGATVIAAASSKDKLDLARQHGADFTINYSSQDLRKALREITPTGAVDVVVDPVGGALAEPAFRSTAWRGRYLVIGFAAGEIPVLPLNLALVKGNAIIGIHWGAYAAREPAENKALLGQIANWVVSKKIAPHIGKIYPFVDAGKAIADLAARRAHGKLVVKIG